jgi:hypothetical protein
MRQVGASIVYSDDVFVNVDRVGYGDEGVGVSKRSMDKNRMQEKARLVAGEWGLGGIGQRHSWTSSSRCALVTRKNALTNYPGP